jgi:CubicO group peptidase (beta-lactamase class C family)
MRLAQRPSHFDNLPRVACRDAAGFRSGWSVAMLCCVLLFVLAAAARTAMAATAPLAASDRSPHDRGFDAIEADIDAEVASGRLPGVAMALVKDGRIVFERGFGWADREKRIEATAHTPFSIASLTKSFTTTSLMTLVAAGKLQLDKPANDYLGAEKIVDRDGPAQAVTVRRLATHSSGLPSFFIMYPQDGPATPPPMSEQIGKYGHLVAPVGERYEYSNLGFGILGDIIARVSHQELGAYMQEHVLAPLGMKDSFFDTDVSRRAGMAVRYDDNGKPMPFYLTATPGSGELYASAHDMALYAMFHLKDRPAEQQRILTVAQLDELHRPRTRIGAHDAYAMGWNVLRQPGRPEVIHHNGGQPGVSSDIVLVPAQDAGCVALSNTAHDNDFVGKLCDRMLAAILPGWQDLPDPENSPPAPLRPLKAYAGQWHGTMRGDGRSMPVTLVIDGKGQATLAVAGGAPRPVTDLGLVDGQLSGASTGDVDTPDAQLWQTHRLELGLTFRGQRIDGELVVWKRTADNITILPFRVDLSRKTGVRVHVLPEQPTPKSAL